MASTTYEELQLASTQSVRIPATQIRLSGIWVCTSLDDAACDDVAYYAQWLAEREMSCELVVVLNGNLLGQEPLAARLLAIEAQCRREGTPRLQVQIVQLHRYCDESTAIQAGLETSSGDVVVLLPTYVQSDPDAILEMLEEIEDGADYVASWRNPRIDSRWSARTSTLFNWMTRQMTGVALHDINSGLRLMRREVAERLPLYGDLHRFLPILAAMHGYVVAEVPVHHLREERAERGGGRLGVYLRRVLDLLTLFFLYKFTKRPLRFFGLMGSLSFVAGTGVFAIVGAQRMAGIAMADRPALLLAIVCVVLGVQLFSVGLLGELIIFTYGRRLFHLHAEEVLVVEESAYDDGGHEDSGHDDPGHDNSGHDETGVGRNA